MEKRISVAVMVRNEAIPLQRVLPQIPRKIFDIGVDIFVMNDGSTDGSEIVAANNGFEVINFLPAVGLSKAIYHGMKIGFEEGYTYHLNMDGDGQHDPSYLPGIITELEKGSDVVVNSRYRFDSSRRGEPPLDRQLLNVEITAAFNRITDLGLTDPICGLRGYNRKAMEFLLKQKYITEQRPDSHGFPIESLLRLWHNGQFRIVEIAHPSIYLGDGKLEHIYQPQYLEERLKRFKIYAGHLVLVMNDLGLKFL